MARSAYAGEIEASMREDGLSRHSAEYRTKKTPVEAPVDGRSTCEGDEAFAEPTASRVGGI